MTAQDRNERKKLREQLGRIMKREELKWFEGYKDKEIRMGDSNTRYHHVKAIMEKEGRI